MSVPFRLNKPDAKMAGVCAGIADRFTWDVTWVRVGTVLLTIAGGFPWTLIAYGLTAWFAQPKTSRF